MGYLKFAMLCFLAVVIGLGSLVTGAVWAPLVPLIALGVLLLFDQHQHLKFGYGVWLTLSFALLPFFQWWANYEYLANPDHPSPSTIGLGFFFLWLMAAIAVNPASYWLGKMLARKFQH